MLRPTPRFTPDLTGIAIATLALIEGLAAVLACLLLA